MSLNGILKRDPRTEVSRFTASLLAGKVPISVSGELSLAGPGGIQGILSNPQGAGRSIPDALSGRQPATSDPPVKADQPKSESPVNGVQGIINLFRKKK